MISKESVLKIHELSILKYGGSVGVRDEGLLERRLHDHIKHLMVRIYILQFMKKQQQLQKVLLLIILLLTVISVLDF